MINFAGKVAIITGGTSGIGRAAVIATPEQRQEILDWYHLSPQRKPAKSRWFAQTSASS